jgi:choline dehydrogenase-like flavoprotein
MLTRLPLPPMRRHALDDEVDAVVIGTGAGGGPLLSRLAAGGLRVVALEAGAWWDPASFAADEQEQEALFWNDERLSTGDDPLAFGRNNSGRAVGGSTVHYTAFTPRPQRDDFRLRTMQGVGADWPLGYDDLAPYFDELERRLPVCGPSPYPWGEPHGYPLPPLELNAPAQLVARGCAQLGIRTAPAPNAALSQARTDPTGSGGGDRPACTHRGFCQAGCSTGAKGTADVVFVPPALAAGAELRTEAQALRLETARGDAERIAAVVYRQDGVERRQRCAAVFLCAGAVETPRLLLLSGLADDGGHVGRHFLAHTSLQVWARFAEAVRPYKGIPAALISEDFHRPADADFAGGYLLQSLGIMPVTYASQVARGLGLWGEPLRAHLRGYNHRAGIDMHGECLPYPGNRLELADERDDAGLPKPRISFSAGENERRMARHGERVMRAVMEAAGGRELWSYGRAAHTLGTCRMASRADDGVADADGHAFARGNLWIADGSLFPSALAVNPALTIMALGLRIADRFLDRRRRGELDAARAGAAAR